MPSSQGPTRRSGLPLAAIVEACAALRHHARGRTRVLRRMHADTPRSTPPGAHRLEVPPSKSLHQRALALTALAGGPSDTLDRMLRTDLEPGEDVRAFHTALRQLGCWDAARGTLGVSRETLRLDLGHGATGFRFAAILASLRPEGARTLITGRPELRARPHGVVRQALDRLGVRVKRRRSGALRVLGGGWRARELAAAGTPTSQHLSALLLAGTRGGPLTVRAAARPVSVPYIEATAAMIEAWGGETRVAIGDGGSTLEVAAGLDAVSPAVDLPADASCAASLFAAAAVGGTPVTVPRLVPPEATAPQADLVLLPLLERMGCAVVTSAAGDVTVCPPSGGLRGLGTVSLRDAPDLVPILASVAALAEGRTRIEDVAHARVKESDRVGRMAAALTAMGVQVQGGAASLAIDGRPQGAGLQGIEVGVRDDHRLAFALGVLALKVPGVRLRGRESVRKSHPRFWADLAIIAGRGA